MEAVRASLFGAIAAAAVALLVLTSNAADSRSADSKPGAAGPLDPPTKPVIHLASLEYPPYTSKDLPGHGYVADIVVSALERRGYPVEVTFYPWARALQLAKVGKVDGVFTIWHRPEREQWFQFSKALPANRVGFFKRRGASIRFSKLEDLASYRIGIVRGYANPPQFEAAAYLQKRVATTDEQNLRKLIACRLDLVLIDRGVAMHLLETKLADARDIVEWLPPALESIDQHIAFSKKSPHAAEYLRNFDLGLEELKKSGEMAKILAKYGLTEEDY